MPGMCGNGGIACFDGICICDPPPSIQPQFITKLHSGPQAVAVNGCMGMHSTNLPTPDMCQVSYVPNKANLMIMIPCDYINVPT